MHPACPNKEQNHLQNSLLRRTQFWVRKTFSKPASLKRASLVSVANKSTKNKDETPSERIFRQCHPKHIEVAFLSDAAVDFFAQDQLLALQERDLLTNKRLTTVDASITDGTNPLPPCLMLQDAWMFGSTKPTSEITAVAHTHPCRYQLGLGIFHVETVVEGMEGGKKSHLLHLCGLLLRLVLVPCHVQIDPYLWRVPLPFHLRRNWMAVLGALCAVTMALLTNRLDLCIQGLFGAGKSNLWPCCFSLF